MLSADVRQCSEDLICNELERINGMREGEDKDRAVANLIKMQHQLNEFNKTDLEEQDSLRRHEIEKIKAANDKLRIEKEAESRALESETNKASKKERRLDTVVKVLGIAVPIVTTGIVEGCRIHNLKTGYAFEARDQVQTSPTFRNVYGKI